jgi:hypothetical protein
MPEDSHILDYVYIPSPATICKKNEKEDISINLSV